MKSYAEVRAEAQAQANAAPGCLLRLTCGLTGEYTALRVPQLQWQHGADRKGELIQPENWEMCLHARGPGGASTTDPDEAKRRAKLGEP